MTRPRVCPYCRQSIKHERYGVPLPPLKAGILDAIKCAGDIGVTSAEIVDGPLYRERRRASHDTVKAHIWQINELLEATAFSITSDRRRWYLRRRMRRVP
jgi:hypothetical protein